MNDFYAKLEEQLVVAGRRRQTQGRIGRAVAGRGRVLVAAGAAAAVFAAAGAVALPSVLTTSSTSGPAALARAPASRASLAGVRVAVFNGTSLAGMARAIADALAQRDARIAQIDSNPGPPAAKTSVLYLRGAQGKARRVAAVLGVAGVDRWGPSTSSAPAPPAIGGDQADVLVIVGADRIGAPPAPPAPPAAPTTPKGAPAVPPAATAPATPAPPAIPPTPAP